MQQKTIHLLLQQEISIIKNLFLKKILPYHDFKEIILQKRQKTYSLILIRKFLFVIISITEY